MVNYTMFLLWDPILFYSKFYTKYEVSQYKLILHLVKLLIKLHTEGYLKSKSLNSGENMNQTIFNGGKETLTL